MAIQPTFWELRSAPWQLDGAGSCCSVPWLYAGCSSTVTAAGARHCSPGHQNLTKHALSTPNKSGHWAGWLAAAFQQPGFRLLTTLAWIKLTPVEGLA